MLTAPTTPSVTFPKPVISTALAASHSSTTSPSHVPAAASSLIDRCSTNSPGSTIRSVSTRLS
eukprot:3682957-Rhodomonas_salina.1